ncbi:MAG: MBL fold metallo-hydrolase [Clostridioides sp.]|jgi:phosphoribosyl 1,2-cyclic phosphodiesterase|nr:MBL fold metallo-hydrolase [Clostridioides sp.]
MIEYCSVGSGSSGNCHFIGYKGTNILVDAGLSGKTITNGLKEIEVDTSTLKGIFITHEHIDHIKGAGILSRKLDIPIYANVKTWMAMQEKLGKIDEKNMKVFENDKTYSLENIVVRPFSIEHDAADPVGYNFYSDNDEKISIATDMGCITENVKKHLFNSKLVVLESNYDKNMLMMGSYRYALKKRVMSDIGHLSNDEAAKFAVELIKQGTEELLLAHLSKENNFPELAYETTKGILAEHEIAVGEDVNLEILRRSSPSKIYRIK